MSYYGGRGNLYRALAAEAMEKDGRRQMVDFKAMAARKKAEKNLTPAPISVSKSIPKEEESIIDNLDELIDNDYTSNWEKNFCRSVRTWLLRDPTNTMSYKQKAVYDKLVKGILERPDTTSAVPTVDNSKKDYKRYEDRALNNDPPFDVNDDDIPY